MILLDSSAWIEFLIGGDAAEEVAPHLKEPERMLLPTIVLYEVYKKVKTSRGEEAALDCVGQMAQAKVIPLDDSIALAAADISIARRLPMADAIVYATARAHRAKVVTLDQDFKGLPETIVIS